jgi:hypothetical protein
MLTKIGNLCVSQKIGGTKAVTLVLMGIQDHVDLFSMHIQSMMERGENGDGAVVLLDYMDRLSLRKTAAALAKFIVQEYVDFQVIYLDGVSCGAKVFAWTILALQKRPDILAKIVFNCINGIVSPADMKRPTLLLKHAFSVDAMLTPLPNIASTQRPTIARLNVVQSRHDSWTGHVNTLVSIMQIIKVDSAMVSVVPIDTEHATSAHAFRKWQDSFYDDRRYLVEVS